MKAKSLGTWKRTGGISGMFVFVLSSLMFFNSCQKDDMSEMNSAAKQEVQSSVDDQSRMVQTENERMLPAAKSYTMIVIDHDGGLMGLQSYRVQVQSDGNAMFTGRRGTGVIGNAKFVLPKTTINALNQLFLSSNFAEIADLPFATDLPLTSTSYRVDIRSELITKIDYNGEGSTKLIGIRNNAEDLMNLSRFVNKQPDNTIKQIANHAQN